MTAGFTGEIGVSPLFSSSSESGSGLSDGLLGAKSGILLMPPPLLLLVGGEELGLEDGESDLEARSSPA